jgi:hypothetical protein
MSIQENSLKVLIEHKEVIALLIVTLSLFNIYALFVDFFAFAYVGLVALIIVLCVTK